MSQRLRFAIAAFNTLHSASVALSRLATERFSLLGLSEVLTDSLPLQPIDLVYASERIACTSGTLSNLLRGADQPTLRQALGLWLLPRHAARIANAVAAGGVVLWVQLCQGDDELAICRELLATSSAPVDVHDFAPSHPT